MRQQLPAWSPVSPGSILAGLMAARRGRSLERLQRQLESENGSSVTLTASGTVALTLALGSAIPDGRPRVALPAWGCPDLATAADGVDAEVRLYDVDPRTLGPVQSSLDHVASEPLDALVLVHSFGIPVDPTLARQACTGAGGLLIDDAAQGVGASFRGRPLGALGDLGVLSFGRGKGRTGGTGGALLAATARGREAVGRGPIPLEQPTGAVLKEAASLGGLWMFARPWLYRLPASVPWLRLGESIYHPPPPKRALSPFAAGVLVAGAASVATESDCRRRLAGWWRNRLGGLDGVGLVSPPKGAEAGWLRFPIIADRSLVGRLKTVVARRLGIMPGYPRLLSELDGFAGRLGEGDRDPAAFPGARTLAGRLFTLPTHSKVSDGDRRAIVGLLA